MSYHIVEMPLNKDGDGPEMDKDKVVKTVYQVWDDGYICLDECETREEAEKSAMDWAYSMFSVLGPGD